MQPKLIYRAAQVQFDVRDDWKADTANGILFLADPKESVILVVQVLDSAGLDKAIKDADTIIKKYVTGVQWHKKPTRRDLNGMKALAFDGGGFLKGDKLDQVNAYYNPYLHVVRLCYELMAEIIMTFHPIVASQAEVLKLTVGVIEFNTNARQCIRERAHRIVGRARMVRRLAAAVLVR